MRPLFVISLTLTLLTVICQAKETSDKKVESVRFAGDEFFFAFEGKNPAGTFKEYIPKGQTLENWTKLAGVYKYPHIKDPFDFAQNLARQIKQDNPLSQSEIAFNEKTGDVIIDFITWPALPAKMEFVEFNIFKFERNGKNGIIGYQYAEREYKNQREFLTNLLELRKKSINAMIDGGLQIENPQRRSNKVSARQRPKRR